MEAVVKLVDGLRFVADGTTGHSIVMDGDLEAGGDDSGPRPTELLLMGLGGCAGMDVISILRKKKQVVTDFEVLVKGVKASSHPKKFTSINIEFVLRGRDISKEAVIRAVDLSMKRYCSVKATIEGVADITWSYTIDDEKQG